MTGSGKREAGSDLPDGKRANGARPNSEPNGGPPNRVGGQTDTAKWEYLGVGCFSTFVGFAGGGMIAVLIAKITGAVSRCKADAETGAPCNWFTYAVFGAIVGALVVPAASLWLFRRGRARANYDRG
jgi:hypothetical protein